METFELFWLFQHFFYKFFLVDKEHFSIQKIVLPILRRAGAAACIKLQISRPNNLDFRSLRSID